MFILRERRSTQKYTHVNDAHITRVMNDNFVRKTIETKYMRMDDVHITKVMNVYFARRTIYTNIHTYE